MKLQSPRRGPSSRSEIFDSRSRDALRTKMEDLQKKISKKAAENQSLSKKLRKLEMSSVGGGAYSATGTPKNPSGLVGNNNIINNHRGSWTSRSQTSEAGRSRFESMRSKKRGESLADSMSSSSDDESEKQTENTPSVIDITMTIAQMMKRKEERNLTNLQEIEVDKLQNENLRKCNQFLALLVGDYNLRWTSYQEIDVTKQDAQTINCNRKLHREDNAVVRVVQIVQVKSQLSSAIKFQAARELHELFATSQEQIFLVLKKAAQN